MCRHPAPLWPCNAEAWRLYGLVSDQLIHSINGPPALDAARALETLDRLGLRQADPADTLGQLRLIHRVICETRSANGGQDGT